MRNIIAFIILVFSWISWANAQVTGYTNIRTSIVQIEPSSYNSPAGEQAPKAFDGSANSKYLNFDKQNMGVGVKISTGRPVSAVGFMTANDSNGRDPMTFSLYGSNDGTTWTALIEHAPTQVSTNRYAQSPITYLSNTTAYAYYYIRFPTMRWDGENSIQIGEIQLMYESTATATSTATGSFGGYPAPTAAPAPIPPATVTSAQTTKISQTSSLGNNSVYIQNSGLYTTVDIEQVGNYNVVRGVNGAQRAVISGDYNTITIKQGGNATPSYNNLVEFSITGNSNNVSLDQKQTNKYAEVIVNSSTNTIDITQHGANAKSAFLNITGGSNTIDLVQQGTGNHFFSVTTAQLGGSVDAFQDGSAQKLFSLTINSPNVGVIVQQTNATTGDSASMSITCSTGPCNGYSYITN